MRSLIGFYLTIISAWNLAGDFVSWHWIIDIGTGGQRDQERCSLMVRISISCMDVRCSDEEFVQPFGVSRTPSGMNFERCPIGMLW